MLLSGARCAAHASCPAFPSPHPLCEGIEIRDVWADTLEEEMHTIRLLAERYKYVAMVSAAKWCAAKRAPRALFDPARGESSWLGDALLARIPAKAYRGSAAGLGRG
jgi:hypothetical protein